MRCTIEEYGKVAEITGFCGVLFSRVDVFLKANRQQAHNGVEIQFFDAELIATSDHLYFATLNALQVHQNQTNISKTIAVETMLYASAKRQIQKAINQIGVKPDSKTTAVVIVSSSERQVQEMLEELTAYLGVEPDDSVLDLTPIKVEKIRAAFQINDREIETATQTTLEAALVDLIVEHVALLATQL